MEVTETPLMHKYGESKTTRIMMATVRHVTSSSGLRTFQVVWFLLNRGYHRETPKISGLCTAATSHSKLQQSWETA